MCRYVHTLFILNILTRQLHMKTQTAQNHSLKSRCLFFPPSSVGEVVSLHPAHIRKGLCGLEALLEAFAIAPDSLHPAHIRKGLCGLEALLEAFAIAPDTHAKRPLRAGTHTKRPLRARGFVEGFCFVGGFCYRSCSNKATRGAFMLDKEQGWLWVGFVLCAA